MSEEAILEEVHNWLGLSLDFLLQEQTPDSSRYKIESPNFTEKFHVSGNTAFLSTKSPAPAIITPPASTDWESPSAEPNPGSELDVIMIGSQSPVQEEQLQVQQQQVPSFDSISNYAVDSPIALLELSYGLVLGPFLEDLLRTYFQNIHPYYPVIDEFDFDVSFSESIDDELLRRSRATVLCSMFLCASMYLNSRQLYGLGKWTQISLQQVVFGAVKDIYETTSTSGDQFSLTQACMLLSYWSPCYPETSHICSTWLSKAFTHAKTAGLDQMTSEVMTDRSRLIWCSLVIRDRVVSFSSRRPLHPMATKENWVRVNKEDFGLEICLPRYSGVEERGSLVDAFLLLCRLSETLADIIEFEMGMKRKLADRGFTVGRKEVLKVSQFDIRLREWKRGFQLWKSGPRTAAVMDGRGSFYLRNVVAESSTATLYVSFIQLTTMSDPLISKFALTAHKKVKDASAKVSETIRDLLATVRPEEIPPFISLWLPLPILTLLVSLKFNRHHPHRQEAVIGDTYRLRHLFSALGVFRQRFRSGQFILDLILGICSELKLGSWDVVGMKFSDPEMPGEGETEAGTLTRAAALIDLGIGNDTSGSSDR